MGSKKKKTEPSAPVDMGTPVSVVEGAVAPGKTPKVLYPKVSTEAEAKTLIDAMYKSIVIADYVVLENGEVFVGASVDYGRKKAIESGLKHFDIKF